MKIGTLKFRVVFVLMMLIGGKAWASDEFAGIKCGTDIPKSLIGKHDSSEPVAVLEKRHLDLNLKDLGGTEISDRLFLASWKICGSEYELLVDTKSGVIRDVLLFPPHSSTSPMSIGPCQSGGKPVPGTTVAVLNNSAGHDPRDKKLSQSMLKTTGAWSIDEAKEKFVKQATESLACPVGGIVTQDGGP